MPDYAVIALGGKQYRVKEGDHLLVDRLAVDEGKSFSPETLMVADGGAISDGGKVEAKVEEHVRGKKIRVFTYKPKNNSRRTKGHRSHLSRVRIESIGS